MSVPAAWLVVTASGFAAVFLDQARAVQYAADSHGTLEPLYRAPSVQPRAAVPTFEGIDHE